MKSVLVAALCLVLCVVAGCPAGVPQVVWNLDRLEQAHLEPEILGAPQVVEKDGRRAMCFDGKADGIFLPLNPIAERDKFTIEVLLRPDGDGPPEQRFLHIQDDQEHRVLLETRVGGGTWSLDTFLRTTDA